MKNRSEAEEALRALDKLLQPMPAGMLTEEQFDEVLSVLQAHWKAIPGSEASKMEAHKLDRVTEISWDPVRHSVWFEVERHGGTVLGSSRAERQGWTVDLTECQAYSHKFGHRQLGPRSPAFPTEAAVAKLIDFVRAGKKDEIKLGASWVSADKLRISPVNFFKFGSSNQKTQAGRSHRIRKAAEVKLAAMHWKLESRGGYWFIERNAS